MKFHPLRLLAIVVLATSISGCESTRPSPVQQTRTVRLTSAEKHQLEQKKIALEQELLALESTNEIQRLMGVYSSLEDAPMSLAVEQTYSVKRYYQLKAMIARIDYLLQ